MDAPTVLTIIVSLLATATLLWIRTGRRHQQPDHDLPWNPRVPCPPGCRVHNLRYLSRRAGRVRPIPQAVSLYPWLVGSGGRAMAVSTLALTATVGCASDTADVPDPATSPVTAVETTALTHLERLEGLYQDRERLLSADGEAYAAAWNMTLHRAKEHVAELIGFHVGAYLGRKLSEEMPHDLAEFRAHVADIIATYAGVTVQEVKADMAAIEPGGSRSRSGASWTDTSIGSATAYPNRVLDNPA